MQVSDLEELSARLCRIREQLAAASLPADKPLMEYDPLVKAARAGEFMLPKPLTVGSLSETVDRKIANVTVLLERARKHEELAQTVQAADDQEYGLASDEYLHGKPGSGAQESTRTPR